MDDFLYSIPDKMRNMRRIRTAAGKSQRWIAARLGTNQAQVSRWETGLHWPSGRTLANLCILLDELQLRLLNEA